MAATLRRFLARLAVDHELLREFIQKPDDVLAGAGLDADEHAALVSRDERRIQLTLAKAMPPEAS
jgi:hypothetical protein